MYQLILLFGALLLDPCKATYNLEDDYNPSNFYSLFTFFTGGDPTNGYVSYVDRATAQTDGLINTSNNQVHIGVDSTNVATAPGRTSVRVTSNKSYNHGLFILDLAHMPGGICGTWPAWWLVGPNWPNEGEIDIIEGVNDQDNDAMTLHTSDNCTITNDGGFTGALGTTNCYIDAVGQSSNAGCSIQNQDTQSYGVGFNNIGGGVYAVEWTSTEINMWSFARSAIPADVTADTPNPPSWGEPVAQFQGGCDIDSHFQNQQINNPSAFAGAYWAINCLKVYQSDGTPAPVTKVDVDEGQMANNLTLPLLTEPLAMGGELPSKNSGSRSRLRHHDLI